MPRTVEHSLHGRQPRSPGPRRQSAARTGQRFGDRPWAAPASCHVTPFGRISRATVGTGSMHSQVRSRSWRAPGERRWSAALPRRGKRRTSIGAARAQARPEVTGGPRGGPSASLGRAPFPPGVDTGRSTAGTGEGLRVLLPPGVCLDECSRLTLLRAGGGSLGLRRESAGSLHPVSPAPPRRCHRGLDAKSAGMMDQAGRAVPPCTG